ncbi:MAG: signal recognition particle-docking protein FtsY [Christensenellales bacterium]
MIRAQTAGFGGSRCSGLPCEKEENGVNKEQNMGLFGFGKKKDQEEKTEKGGFFGFGKKKVKEQEEVKTEAVKPVEAVQPAEQPAQVEEENLTAEEQIIGQEQPIAEEAAVEETAEEKVPAAQAENVAEIEPIAEKKVEEKKEEPVLQEEKKKGLFSRLWEGLSKTRGNFSGRVDELIEATEEIDDDFYEDLVDILIMSDMGVRTSDKVIQELKKRVEEQKITDAKKAREILKDILKGIMTMPRKPLKWPMVMLVVGVNGVGKTTTIGKLAMRFKDARHSVVLAAADTFRAAAADQLQIWSERAQVPIVRHAEGADPAAVVFDGIKKARASEADLLIVDTAGRLHNKKNLMDELNKIFRVITREYEEAEVRTLLVIDATTGQNGLQQAKEFSEVTDVTGIVLTKLDGTAKGGIAVAIMDELKLPVLYIGVGEGIEDLQAFDANAFVDAIF